MFLFRVLFYNLNLYKDDLNLYIFIFKKTNPRPKGLGEEKVERFCEIGGKEVYFCKKCTDKLIGRFDANHSSFVKKGFTPEEIRELQNCIYMYKYQFV